MRKAGAEAPALSHRMVGLEQAVEWKTCSPPYGTNEQKPHRGEEPPMPSGGTKYRHGAGCGSLREWPPHVGEVAWTVRPDRFIELRVFADEVGTVRDHDLVQELGGRGVVAVVDVQVEHTTEALL